MRTALVDAAQAASRVKHSYLGAQFRRTSGWTIESIEPARMAIRAVAPGGEAWLVRIRRM